jgi:hypothetical protein
MSVAVQKWWDRWYPGTLPVADALKWKFADRWVRFHSLPEGKRYASSDSERRVILDRHRIVLSELSCGESLVLVTTTFSEAATPRLAPPERLPALAELDPQAEFWRTLAMHEIEDHGDPPNYWHLLVSEWPRAARPLDPVLQLAANDEIANTLLFDPRGSWLYHPYDGGADVVLGSADERDLLRSAHALWLSQRPDGL